MEYTVTTIAHDGARDMTTYNSLVSALQFVSMLAMNHPAVQQVLLSEEKSVVLMLTKRSDVWSLGDGQNESI